MGLGSPFVTFPGNAAQTPLAGAARFGKLDVVRLPACERCQDQSAGTGWSNPIVAGAPQQAMKMSFEHCFHLERTPALETRAARRRRACWRERNIQQLQR